MEYYNRLSEVQLRKKFKHACDFGVLGHCSSQTLLEFKAAVEAHLESSRVKVIFGTLRGRSMVHYFDPTTSLNVSMSDNGDFVSGWKLSPAQVRALIDSGNVGGG